MHVEMNMDMFLSNLYVIFLIVPQKICLYSDSENKVILTTSQLICEEMTNFSSYTFCSSQKSQAVSSMLKNRNINVKQLKK